MRTKSSPTPPPPSSEWHKRIAFRGASAAGRQKFRRLCRGGPALLKRSPTPPPPSLDGHRRWKKAGMALSAYSLHRRKRCPSARETLGVSLGRLKRTQARMALSAKNYSNSDRCSGALVRRFPRTGGASGGGATPSRCERSSCARSITSVGTPASRATCTPQLLSAAPGAT